MSSCGKADEDGVSVAKGVNEIQTLMSSAGGNVKINSLTMGAVAYAAPDTSLYRIRYALSKPLLTNDTVYVRFRRDTTFGNVRVDVTKKSVKQRDSLDFKVAKVFGKKADYSALLRDMRNGTAIVSKSITWQSNFPADSTPPVIDTLNVDSTLAILKLDIKPDTVKLFASHYTDGTVNTDSLPKTQQFCPLVVFADGKVALPTQYKSLSPCPTEYGKLALAVRSVSVKQQAKADSVCVKWSATGGTITADLCGGVPT